MSTLHPAATLPKGFRYDGSHPRTPEPIAPGDDDVHLASPPRPRLKLKRRNISSHLQPPTQQFLASVAAADVPIPSVEEPQFATRDEEMIDGLPEIRLHDDYDDLDVYHRLHARTFSPPKTPAGDSVPSIPVAKYPNWSIDSSWSGSDLESSPEYESSRPSTAFSTQTTSSLFSQFSHPSDDGECFSPELDNGDFQMPDSGMAGGELERRRPRRAPWTKAMSSHLWSTYLLYQQDPKVTPVRLGKSCIPPEGVCARVAREARRSWRGAKQTAAAARSGSSTPTAESSKPFMEWPHTCAATRAHLRELCRLKTASKQGRSTYISQSPTPFNKAAHRRWNRRSTPARSPSIFSAQDMAMSLTLSTSEAMQPQGPLAQLANSQPASTLDIPVAMDPLHDSSALFAPDDTTAAGQARLGSPFLAKSYGPSSSSSLAESLHVRRHSHTVGPRKLLSPVRLTRSRSKSGPQKRRSFKGIEDPPRKRPSLAAALWGPPTEPEGQVRSDDTEVPFSSTESSAGDSLFIPRTPGGDMFSTNNAMSQNAMTSLVAGSLPPAPASIPARLGSPFSSSHTSHSFPNRLSQPINFNLSALRRPFATVQQTTDSSTETAPARSSLASRLAYLDQRLRELRSRNVTRRRSQSPL